MIGGKSAVLSDVLPYSLVAGNPACFQGLNLVGLRRRGANREELRALSAWSRIVYPPAPHLSSLPPLQERVRLACIAEQAATLGLERVEHVLAFLRRPHARGLCRARASADPDENHEADAGSHSPAFAA